MRLLVLVQSQRSPLIPTRRVGPCYSMSGLISRGHVVHPVQPRHVNLSHLHIPPTLPEA